jgi:hypothetical protein
LLDQPLRVGVTYRVKGCVREPVRQSGTVLAISPCWTVPTPTMPRLSMSGPMMSISSSRLATISGESTSPSSPSKAPLWEIQPRGERAGRTRHRLPALRRRNVGFAPCSMPRRTPELAQHRRIRTTPQANMRSPSLKHLNILSKKGIFQPRVVRYLIPTNGMTWYRRDERSIFRF